MKKMIKKIIYVVGARPQFMQAAMVSKAISSLDKDIDFRIVHTGQHFDRNMSEIFFEQLKIPKPYTNLEIHSLSHGAMVGRIMESLEGLVMAEKPDMLVMDGDTNSTLAGALVAAKLKIKSVHIESGMRSFDMRMPEEINRVVADNCCTYLYCPTLVAYSNLEKSGLSHKAKVVGDVLYDAFCLYSPFSCGKSEGILQRRGIVPGNYALVTLHREENLEDKKKMQEFCECLSRLEKPVLFPIHPRTNKVLNDYDIDLTREKNIHRIEPVGYLEMLDLEAQSAYIITDSGGVQREAYWSKKPLFILRDTTEWMEQLSAGWAMLISRERLFNVQECISDLIVNLREDCHPDYYGDGMAATKIARDLAAQLI